ncbi:MAG: hypothetical protein GY711_11325 [bacterium]|nr:hypothetical protein [bacterium]
MSGLALTYDAAQGGFDLALDGDRLAVDAGIVTPVLVSLWSDARVDADELVPDGLSDRRGWWPDTEDDRHGSLLWLLEREKATVQTAARAEEFARGALQWLLDGGIAESIDVEGSILPHHRLCLDIKVRRAVSGQWEYLWEGTETYLEDVGGVRLQLTAA